MQKKKLLIGLMLLLVALPNGVYAQKKPTTELDCGCEITTTTHKCGECGGIMDYSYTYECSKKKLRCSKQHQHNKKSCYISHHIHSNLSDDYDYIHKCKEGKCVKYEKWTEEGEIFYLFENVCKVKKTFNLSVGNKSGIIEVGELEPGEKKEIAISSIGKIYIQPIEFSEERKQKLKEY